MGTAFALDQTKANRYKIQYKGDFGVVKFYIANPTDGSWTLVHTIQHPGTSLFSTVDNAHLQLRASVENDGVTIPSSSVELKVLSLGAYIEGELTQAFAVRNSLENGTGTNITTAGQTLLSIQNSNSYQGFDNHILVYVDQLDALVRGVGNRNRDIVISLYLNNSGTDFATSIQNPNANTSVVVEDSSYTISSDKKIASFYCRSNGTNNANNKQTDKNSSLHIDLTDYNIVLYPGDILTVVGRMLNTSNVDAFAALSWTEQH